MFDRAEQDPTTNVQVFSKELSEEEILEVQGIEKRNYKQTSTVVSAYSYKDIIEIKCLTGDHVDLYIEYLNEAISVESDLMTAKDVNAEEIKDKVNNPFF